MSKSRIPETPTTRNGCAQKFSRACDDGEYTEEGIEELRRTLEKQGDCMIHAHGRVERVEQVEQVDTFL